MSAGAEHVSVGVAEGGLEEQDTGGEALGGAGVRRGVRARGARGGRADAARVHSAAAREAPHEGQPARRPLEPPSRAALRAARDALRVGRERVRRLARHRAGRRSLVSVALRLRYESLARLIKALLCCSQDH